MKRRNVALLILLILLIGVTYTVKANKDAELRCGDTGNTATAETTTSTDVITTEPMTISSTLETTTEVTSSRTKTERTTLDRTTESSVTSEKTGRTETTFATATSSTRYATNATTVATTNARARTDATVGPTENSKPTDATTTNVTGASGSTMDTTTRTGAIAYSCNSFDYVVRDLRTETPCVLMNMTMQMNVHYETEDRKMDFSILMVPRRMNVTGLCRNRTAEMTLSWRESVDDQSDNHDYKDNNIMFLYARDDSRFFLETILVDVYLDDSNFPYARYKRMRGNTAEGSLRLFSASIKRGIFKSKIPIRIHLGDEISLIVYNVSLVAFNGCGGDTPKTVSEAPKATTDVPSIVGGLIGAVFLILVISFLIWRKRRKDVIRSENLIP